MHNNLHSANTTLRFINNYDSFGETNQKTKKKNAVHELILQWVAKSKTNNNTTQNEESKTSAFQWS